MSYEHAVEALKTGDFRSAASLLETAARESDFSSDIINNAYTLALYRLGDQARLAEAAYKVGLMLVDRDPGSAMDYFQRALSAGLNGASVRRIGAVFEKWAAKREHVRIEGPVKKVAHVVGGTVPGHPVSRYLKIVCSSLEQLGIESSVFTTESTAAWFYNPVAAPQSKDIGIPRTTIAAVNGDFSERAEAVAAAVRASGASAAFYHGDLQEQIMARIAAYRPTPIQINVNHGVEMNTDLFDGRIHFFKAAFDRSAYRTQPAALIPPTSDIETRLRAVEPVSRQSLGIDADSTISATFGDLQKTGAGYVRVLTEVLKRFPRHFHLFAGAGDVKSIRGPLHAEGVLPRVRFLGQMSDTAPLLPIIDVYFASFPYCEASSLLDAMGAGMPIVALRSFAAAHDNTGADLLGIPELIVPGEANYIELADRLVRDGLLRAKHAATVQERFQTKLHPTKLAERYVDFLESVISA